MAESEAPEDLSGLLARLRKDRRAGERGLKDVAASVGVSFQAIARWESGEDRPSVDRMRKWLRAVELPLEWAELYDQWRALEQLDALMERYGIEDDYRRLIRLSFRDGLRHGGVPKKLRAAGSSR